MERIVLTSIVLGCVVVLSWAWRILNWIWWKPMMMERCLRKQGIKGPPYRLLYGNMKEKSRLQKEGESKPMNLSHDIVPRVTPFYQQIVKKYGKMPVYWLGTHPRVIITDTELIKDILSNKFGDFHKLKSTPLTKWLATGLGNYDGHKWAKHRRIINPAFHLEKLKNMLPMFYASCRELVSRWENMVMSEGLYELDVWPEFQYLTGVVISRTAFGSSYEEGRRIFQLQNEQAKFIMELMQSANIPGYSFLPTKRNNRMKEIDREIRVLLRDIIDKREKAINMGETSEDDLLGLLMESNIQEIKENGNNMNVGMSIEEVMEECKLFYFAGQETTSVLLVWTIVVLRMHPNWQVQAREEIMQVFGNNKPDFNGLNHLKIVTMILYEVLRLYPPAINLVRCTCKQTKLGDISLPPGVQLLLPTILVHHDRELWGEDVKEFKPERFKDGVSKATKNQISFFPFGWGPRICIGQNFSMIEAKIALAMILQRFTFELSPTYAHAPSTIITLQPYYGAQIILRNLKENV